MNEYIIQWNRDDYGYIKIKADTLEEAKELFRCGQYDDKDLITRGGSIELEDITPTN